jgi:hypothetical protein
MATELTAEQKYDWLLSTLRQVSMLQDLSDDDLVNLIFEDLEIDVRSALSKENVDFFVCKTLISEPAAKEILSVRDLFLAKVASLHKNSKYLPEDIKKDSFLDDISKRSQRAIASIA